MGDRQLWEVDVARQRKNGTKVYRLPTFWVWAESKKEASRQARAIVEQLDGYTTTFIIREA